MQEKQQLTREESTEQKQLYTIQENARGRQQGTKQTSKKKVSKKY